MLISKARSQGKPYPVSSTPPQPRSAYSRVAEREEMKLLRSRFSITGATAAAMPASSRSRMDTRSMSGIQKLSALPDRSFRTKLRMSLRTMFL